MVEALVGSIIAVIATGGLAMMAEVFTATQDTVLPRPLSPYEENVLDVVSSAHDVSAVAGKPDLENWLQERWRAGL